jgi:hypothetical protein
VQWSALYCTRVSLSAAQGSGKLLLGNGGIRAIFLQRMRLSGLGRLRHSSRHRNIRDGNVGKHILGLSPPPPNVFSNVPPYGQLGR